MRLYLSYRRTDRELVAKVASALAALGHDVWWDGLLAPGAAFEKQFADNMRAADAFVAFLSRESIDGVQQPQEVALALSESKRIVPVRLEAFDAASLPFSFGTAQTLDATDTRSPDVLATRIAEALKSMVDADIAKYATLHRDIRAMPRIKFIAKAAREAQEPPPESAGQAKQAPAVFIVHGHDEAMMDEVSDFLRNNGVTPIVLKKLRGGQNTLFDKFNTVGRQAKFAVALVSADDQGASLEEYKEAADRALQYRARQNVVLELGFFFGKLGWDNVFVLLKAPPTRVPRFERPSDLDGVIFETYDASGQWKAFLLEQLRERELIA